MHTKTDDLPPPVNYVFVDYENVHTVDPAIIGSKTVHFTLLLGSRQTKLDVTLVEKLLLHAANVELVRLKSSGRDALDFSLAYYLGRAVLANPCGYFHIVSKDKGYDPLIEHLRSKHIHVRRHENFTKLTFSAIKPSEAPSQVAAPAAKSPAKLTIPPTRLENLEVRVLDHLCKPTTKRPGTKEKLASYLIAHLGKQGNKTDAEELIEMLSQAGHIVIDDNSKVTYRLK